MKTMLIALVVAATACASGTGSGTQQTGAQAAAPDSARLMRTLSVLVHDSMEGRRVGTPGGERARAFLVKEFERRGIKPLAATGYVQPFRMAAGRNSTDSLNAANVVGIIRGTKQPDKYIVVTAHYDHLGVQNGNVYNGADDNASGSAAILEVASWFVANPPSHSIIIAAFDAEERGLTGARKFVELRSDLLPDIIANINLDMVGRNEKNELYVAGTHAYPQLMPYVQAAKSRSGLTLIPGHDGTPNTGDNWTGQSDQGAFHAKQIPFLYFGVEDHPDYHKHTDELAGIMPGFYVNVVRTVLDVARQIDANPPTR